MIQISHRLHKFEHELPHFPKNSETPHRSICVIQKRQSLELYDYHLDPHAFNFKCIQCIVISISIILASSLCRCWSMTSGWATAVTSMWRTALFGSTWYQYFLHAWNFRLNHNTTLTVVPAKSHKLWSSFPTQHARRCNQRSNASRIGEASAQDHR